MNKFYRFTLETLLLLLILPLRIFTQGKSWQLVSGPFNAEIQTLTAGDNYIYAGTNGDGLYVSDNNGSSWTNVTSGIPAKSFVAALIKGGNYVYAGLETGFYQSSDYGFTWAEINSGLPVSYPDVTALAMNNSYMFAGIYQEGIYRIGFGSTSWEQVSVGIPAAAWTTTLLVNGTSVFAGTAESGLYRSTNNGASWTQLTNGLTSSQQIWALAASGSNIYAGAYGGVYLSTDNGNSWKNISSGLPNNQAVFALAVSGPNIFAGSRGIYFSSDSGSNWSDASNGLPNTLIYYSLALSNSKIYVGTDTYQIFSNSVGSFLPQTINISGKTLTFGDPAKSSGFRMIGLPGQSSNLKVSDFLQGEAKKDWTAFYDNGAESNYFVEYDGSSLFNFGPGKGFWLLSKTPMGLSGQVASVTLTGGNYSIPLHSGWNIISDPFENSVPWTNVRNVNGLSTNDYLHNWDGSQFANSSNLNAYEAYYFYNTGNLTSLKIPYVFGPTLEKILPDTGQTVKAENTLIVSLLNDGHVSSQVNLGVNKNSLDDYDQLDCLAPPGDFEEEGIRIINKKISIAWKELSADFRKQIGNGQYYELLVRNNYSRNLVLSFEGAECFKDYEVWAADRRLNNLHNLKINKTVRIPSYVKSGKFDVLIGRGDFITSEKNKLIPVEFSLYQNYPNPFNPFTVIRYSTPVKAYVTLRLYDITGRKVKELENSIKEAGFYEVPFNASNLASGIYLYRIEIRNNDGILYSSDRKMCFVK